MCVFTLHSSIKEEEHSRGRFGEVEGETWWGLASCWGKFVDDGARCCLMIRYLNACACCCCLTACADRRNKLLSYCHQTHGVERPTISVPLIGIERRDSKNYSLGNIFQIQSVESEYF